MNNTEQIWQMKFHPDKCQVLTITRKKEPIVQLCVGPSHTREDPRDRDGPEKSSTQCEKELQEHTQRRRYAQRSQLVDPRNQKEEPETHHESMMYKIHNNLVGIDRGNFLEEKRWILPSHTHCYQYQVPKCTKDYHYYSFFPRATREWNKLSDAVHAITVEAFKAKLLAAAATDN